MDVRCTSLPTLARYAKGKAQRASRAHKLPVLVVTAQHFIHLLGFMYLSNQSTTTAGLLNNGQGERGKGNNARDNKPGLVFVSLSTHSKVWEPAVSMG